MTRSRIRAGWRSWVVLAGLGCQLISAPRSAAQEAAGPLAAAATPATADAQWIVPPGGAPAFEQSVQFVVPAGAKVAYWDGQKFVDAGESSAILKLLVGGVYQLRVTQIPQAPGAEIFPTIEVLNRLNPPPELTEEFSVVVEIPWDDLLQAIDGKLVTRVVYLEDPETAMPYPQAATEQPYFDVTPREDPLRVAQKLGRPMARVRLGSRIPDAALGPQ